MNASLVTFIAQPATSGSTKGLDGNLAIEEIFTALDTAAKQPGADHTIYRVPSLRHIHTILRTLNYQPGVIQITGHSMPGMLMLGSYWDGIYIGPDGDARTLDSNPYVYPALGEVVAPPTLVVLAGCDVGSDQASVWPVGGEILVTSLNGFLGCDVVAATDYVCADDFTDGRYVGPMNGWIDGEWVDSSDDVLNGNIPFKGSSKVELRILEPRDDYKLAFARVVSIPALHRLPAIEGDLISADLDLGEFAQRIELGEIVASPEIVLEGGFAGGRARFLVMRNASLVEVIERNGRRHHFRRPPQAPPPQLLPVWRTIRRWLSSVPVTARR